MIIITFKVSEEDLILGKWFSCFWIKAPIILDGCNLYDFDVCSRNVSQMNITSTFYTWFCKLNSPLMKHFKCVQFYHRSIHNIMISKLHVFHMWPWWGSILHSMSKYHNDFRSSQELQDGLNWNHNSYLTKYLAKSIYSNLIFNRK